MRAVRDERPALNTNQYKAPTPWPCGGRPTHAHLESRLDKQSPERLNEVEGTRLLRLLYPHKGTPHKRIQSACLPFRRLSRPSRALAPRRPTAASSTSPYGCFGAGGGAAGGGQPGRGVQVFPFHGFLHGFFVS